MLAVGRLEGTVFENAGFLPLKQHCNKRAFRKTATTNCKSWKAMATARQLATQLLKAYTAVRLVEVDHQKYKIDALLNSRPKYRLLNLEHPYYDMAKQATKARREVEKVAATLLASRIGDMTVREALEAMQEREVRKGKRSPYIDNLLAL